MLRQSLYMLLIFLSLLISGCWDAQDLEDLAFPMAAAYDKHATPSQDQSDPGFGELKVDVTTATPNLIPQAKAKVRVETVSGATVAYARDKRAFETANRYFPGLVEVIVVGEELAREGLRPHLDSIYRIPLASNSIDLAVAEGRGEEILRTKLPENENTAVYINDLLNDLSDQTFIPTTTLHEFNVEMAPGKNPVLPILKKEKEDAISIAGVAVFNKDKLIDKLDLTESRSLVLLRGVKAAGYIPYSLYRNGQLMESGSAQVRNSRHVTVKKEGERYRFTIEITLEGNITERSSAVTFTDTEESFLQEVEQTIAGSIQQEAAELLDKMQNIYKTDIIDINRYALAKDRKKLKDEIDADFIEKAQIEVKVKVHLKNLGESE